MTQYGKILSMLKRTGSAYATLDWLVEYMQLEILKFHLNI